MDKVLTIENYICSMIKVVGFRPETFSGDGCCRIEKIFFLNFLIASCNQFKKRRKKEKKITERKILHMDSRCI